MPVPDCKKGLPYKFNTYDEVAPSSQKKLFIIIKVIIIIINKNIIIIYQISFITIISMITSGA